MHRSIAYLGVALFLLSITLVAFPIWAYGAEQFDPEQELGVLLLPAGLLVLLAASVSTDPRTTTVGGAFGNPEFDRSMRAARASSPTAPRIAYHPREAVQCEQCNTVITPDLARCPRCGRSRPCRTCGRPLGLVLERPTCPRCAKAEVFCDCPILPKSSPQRDRVRSRTGRR